MLSKKTKIWTLFMGICIINLSCSSEESLLEVTCGEACTVNSNNLEDFTIIEEPYERGQCQSGWVQCGNGDPICVDWVGPTTEKCDYIDNDCDDEVDEELGFEVGAECTFDEDNNLAVPEEVPLGTCSNGLAVCALDGSVVCEGVVNPTTEVCDGLDNDCDGVLDEAPANPPSMDCPTVECLPQDPVCRDGNWTCPSEVALGDEICDGLDNDCDGLIDENEDHDPLFDGNVYVYDGDINETASGPCRPGVRQCIDGVETIVGMVTPKPETCDLIDNDCDGTIDNNLIDVYENDYTGPPGTLGVGVCTPASATCNDGELTHTSEVLPTAENCSDSLDNDCDGFINEATTEAVTQAFVLVLDISGSMSYYLDPMMEALCEWSSTTLLGGSKFNIVVVGNSEGDEYNVPPVSLTNGFVGASGVCDALFGPNGYESFNTSGSEYQFWGVEIATQYAWPYGLSRNVIVFSDEPLQERGIFNGWTFSLAAMTAFAEHCIEQNYRLITYSRDYIQWWSDLAQDCNGTTHQLINDRDAMLTMLLNDFAGNCIDPAIFQ